MEKFLWWGWEGKGIDRGIGKEADESLSRVALWRKDLGRSRVSCVMDLGREGKGDGRE